jgi:autotransporter-associated beta strand protein
MTKSPEFGIFLRLASVLSRKGPPKTSSIPKTMKSKINPFCSTVLSNAAVVFACFTLLNTGAQASTGSWIGSAGDHGILNPSNWTPAGVPSGFAEVNFDSNTVDGTMDLSGLTMTLSSLTLSSTLTVPITINTGNFVVGSGLIDLSAANVDLTINSAYNLWFPSAIFNVGAGRTLTLNGAVSDVGFTDDGPKPFTKNGAGTALLSGANTYRGSTTISAGTLEIGGAGTLGNGSYAGDIGISGALVYSSSANQILSGIITGSGSITKNGSGTLTLTQATNGYPIHLFDGAITINSGTLVAADVSFGLNSTDFNIYLTETRNFKF